MNLRDHVQHAINRPPRRDSLDAAFSRLDIESSRSRSPRTHRKRSDSQLLNTTIQKQEGGQNTGSEESENTTLKTHKQVKSGQKQCEEEGEHIVETLEQKQLMKRLATHEKNLLAELEATRRLMGNESSKTRKWIPRGFTRLHIPLGYSGVTSRTSTGIPTRGSIFSEDEDESITDLESSDNRKFSDMGERTQSSGNLRTSPLTVRISSPGKTNRKSFESSSGQVSFEKNVFSSAAKIENSPTPFERRYSKDRNSMNRNEDGRNNSSYVAVETPNRAVDGISINTLNKLETFHHRQQNRRHSTSSSSNTTDSFTNRRLGRSSSASSSVGIGAQVIEMCHDGDIVALNNTNSIENEYSSQTQTTHNNRSRSRSRSRSGKKEERGRSRSRSARQGSLSGTDLSLLPPPPPPASQQSKSLSIKVVREKKQESDCAVRDGDRSRSRSRRSITPGSAKSTRSAQSASSIFRASLSPVRNTSPNESSPDSIHRAARNSSTRARAYHIKLPPPLSLVGVGNAIDIGSVSNENSPQMLMPERVLQLSSGSGSRRQDPRGFRRQNLNANLSSLQSSDSGKSTEKGAQNAKSPSSSPSTSTFITPKSPNSSHNASSLPATDLTPLRGSPQRLGSSPQSSPRPNLALPRHMRTEECNSPASVGSAVSASAASRSHRRRRLTTTAAPPSPLASCLSEDEIRHLIRGCQRHNIRCIAFDFDLTLVSIHTAKPYWRGPLATLATYMRPLFVSLIRVALRCGIMVVVATNNKKPNRIAAMLRIAFNDLDTSRIVVRGKDGSWLPEAHWGCEKKVPFILSALQELRQRHERDFDNEEPLGAKHVLMIDDDMMNVMACEMNGIRAVHLDSDLIIEGRNRCEEQVASELWSRLIQNKPPRYEWRAGEDEVSNGSIPLPTRIRNFRIARLRAAPMLVDEPVFWADELTASEEDTPVNASPPKPKRSALKLKMNINRVDGSFSPNHGGNLSRISSFERMHASGNKQSGSGSHATKGHRRGKRTSMQLRPFGLARSPAMKLGKPSGGMKNSSRSVSKSPVASSSSPRDLEKDLTELAAPVPLSLATSIRIATARRAAAVTLQAASRGTIVRRRLSDETDDADG
eukprot:g1462.t1